MSKSEGATKAKLAPEQLKVHIRVVTGVTSFEDLNNALHMCHEHQCPACGLTWGHSHSSCMRAEELWLPCPICQRTPADQLAYSFD